MICISGLQDATLVLDYRVTNLEENGGNANITDLETRISDLEVATGEQETRITTNQENIEGMHRSRQKWQNIKCQGKHWLSIVISSKHANDLLEVMNTGANTKYF